MVFLAFASLIGQPQAVELLSCAVLRQRIAPAYLFAGASGVGRSRAARSFAALLLSGGDPLQPLSAALVQRITEGNHPDLLWVAPTYLHQGKRLSAAEAVELGIKRRSPPIIRLEQIREITQFLSRPPIESFRSVVVIEQAETMAEPAANALLKTLEEPGAATLILIAPSPDALLPTLVSRCQRVPFQRLSADAIAQVLQQAGQSEVLQHPAVLALAQGSPGDAIFHWQQMQALPAELRDAAASPPRSPRHALELAGQIAKGLDTEAQLWLIDYLQHCYWQQRQVASVEQLEAARSALKAYAQERLVWEVTLLAIAAVVPLR